MRDQVWAREVDMFTSYVSFVEGLGFHVYPESCGHDLVLVAPDPVPPYCGDLRPGDVIVVEGKLRGSVGVLAQALPPHRCGRTYVGSADWYVVLVPSEPEGFGSVARAAGVVVQTWPHGARRQHLANFMGSLRAPGDWKRLALPSVKVAGITPGAPSPRSVTEWKVAAVKLCLLGKERDLSSAEVGKLRRRFVEAGWLAQAGAGKTATFRLLDAANRPDVIYPEIVEAIAAARSLESAP